MENGYYTCEWPRDGIHINTFVHELSNYRYHWHREEYELNILLCGNQDFCVGPERLLLQEDDVLLIPPGTGHASFAQQPGTRALVLHFNVNALRPLVRKGFAADFHLRLLRDTPLAAELRFYAAMLYRAAAADRPEMLFAMKGALLQLIAALFREAAPEEYPVTQDERQSIIRGLTAYVDGHFAEKVTLEDLADYSGYNRTYISTLFKECTGTGFHEYLTRVRFQHALLDLAAVPDKPLTAVALDNGFPDLKSLNKCVRELLGRSPAEYRAELGPQEVISSPLPEKRRYIPPEDAVITRKLTRYTALTAGKPGA